MSYRAAVFDLFGTLVRAYSAEDADRVVVEMADAVGAPADAFLVRWNKHVWHARLTGALPSVEAAIEAICRALDVPVRAEQVARASRLRLDFARRALTPQPDVLPTLARIREMGCDLGLVSECSADVPAVWSESALAPLFDVPVFSCDVGLTKPDPRIYEIACARLAVSPAECLYVGDGSSQELSGARLVGMTPVLVRTRYDHCHIPDPRRPDVDGWQGDAVDHVRDILPLLT